MQNQLQLEDYYLTKLHVDWRSPSKPKVHVEEIQTGIDYDVAVNAKEKHRYKLEVRIHLAESGKEEKEVGYTVVADIVGFFAFPEDAPEDVREKMIRINGLNILYGTFRGMLAGVTGMFPGNRLALPTIWPLQVVQRVEEAKKTKQARVKENKVATRTP